MPVLVKALDLAMNSARAVIPFGVPRISSSMMYLEALVSMYWYWVYLGHSLRIWFLVSRVELLQGHMLESGERGRGGGRSGGILCI